MSSSASCRRTTSRIRGSRPHTDQRGKSTKPTDLVVTPEPPAPAHWPPATVTTLCERHRARRSAHPPPVGGGA
jgi:hypothetical protein